MSNYAMNSTRVVVKTWFQNLPSPFFSHSYREEIDPYSEANSQYSQPLFSDNFDPQFCYLNVSLPSF